MTQATETAPYHPFAAAGTVFALAKLEAGLTSEACLTLNPGKEANSESKGTRKMMTQNETENVPGLCWEPWTALLQTLSSGAMKSFCKAQPVFVLFAKTH